MSAPTPITLAGNARGRLAGTDIEALASELGETPRAAAWRAAWADLGDPPRVYGSMDLAGARESRDGLSLPCLLVAPLGESLRDDLAPGGSETIQRVVATLAVIAGVPARNDPRGRRAAEGDGRLDALVAASRAQLVGWVPARRWDPLAIRRSRLLALEGGRAFWQDEYTTFGWASRPRTN